MQIGSAHPSIQVTDNLNTNSPVTFKSYTAQNVPGQFRGRWCSLCLTRIEAVLLNSSNQESCGAGVTRSGRSLPEANHSFRLSATFSTDQQGLRISALTIPSGQIPENDPEETRHTAIVRDKRLFFEGSKTLGIGFHQRDTLVILRRLTSAVDTGI